MTSTFIKSLGLSSAVLVGHSIGGAAVTLAAQRQPGWLSRLVLEEPTILRPGVPKLDLPPRPDGPLNLDWEGIVPALIAEFNNPDPAWWERLRDITVPTLVLIGTDRPGPKERRMIDAATQIPGSRVETIAVGHDIHQDATDPFMRAL